MRFSASIGLSRGQPSGDRSVHSVVETMKGISWELIPSPTRSSAVMRGCSSEWISLSVGYSEDSWKVAHSESFGFHRTC